MKSVVRRLFKRLLSHLKLYIHLKTKNISIGKEQCDMYACMTTHLVLKT